MSELKQCMHYVIENIAMPMKLVEYLNLKKGATNIFHKSECIKQWRES